MILIFKWQNFKETPKIAQNSIWLGVTKQVTFIIEKYIVDV